MWPLLQLLSDGEEHRPRDLITVLADHFKLSESDRATLLPSGRDRVFRNRVGWATFYLRKAKVIDDAKRGVLKITPRGLKLSKEKRTALGMKDLEAFPEYVAFRATPASGKRTRTTGAHDDAEAATPEEQIEHAHGQIREALASDLLGRLLAAPPRFFEQVVVDLLLEMGYGGSREDAGERIGQSGDGGIDGIIKEDRLGLDTIYLQAKRWQGVVGRPEIQKFAGALQGHHARKGVFITTSSFTDEAREYAERLESKIALIDGQRLAELMIDHDLGVSTVATYAVKRIDSDFFDEE